jgi:hypothetical protein
MKKTGIQKSCEVVPENVCLEAHRPGKFLSGQVSLEFYRDLRVPSKWERVQRDLFLKIL